jgi:hypothetical protein
MNLADSRGVVTVGVALKLISSGGERRYSENRIRVAVICGAMMLLAGARAQAPVQPFPSIVSSRVRLLAPLTTKFNRKGDMVSARVLEPAGYRGAILEGVIREVKAGGAAGKTSSVQFEILALHLAGEAIPVTAALIEVTNSRGAPNVDEGKVPLESGAGGKSASGGLLHRGPGLPRIATQSADLTFAPGSEFGFELRPRKGR